MFGRSWVFPREVCDACGLRFEREPGYYLLSTWAGSYGLAGLAGIGTWLALELTVTLSTTTLAAIVLPVVLLVALGTLPYTKSVFLAVDLWLDPEGDAGDLGDARR